MNTKNFTAITLTDENDVPNALQKLRNIYENILKLDYDNKRTQKYNSINLEKIQNELKKYSKALKRITYFFEKYININLQVNLEIKKFVVEGI